MPALPGLPASKGIVRVWWVWSYVTGHVRRPASIHVIAAHAEIPVLLGRTASRENVPARQISLSVTGPVLISVAMNLIAARVRKPALPIKPALTEYVRIGRPMSALKGIVLTRSLLRHDYRRY